MGVYQFKAMRLQRRAAHSLRRCGYLHAATVKMLDYNALRDEQFMPWLMERLVRVAIDLWVADLLSFQPQGPESKAHRLIQWMLANRFRTRQKDYRTLMEELLADETWHVRIALARLLCHWYTLPATSGGRGDYLPFRD